MDNEIISDKLSKIGLKATKEVIRLADEVGVDRDELFFNFAASLSSMNYSDAFCFISIKLSIYLFL